MFSEWQSPGCLAPKPFIHELCGQLLGSSPCRQIQGRWLLYPVALLCPLASESSSELYFMVQKQTELCKSGFYGPDLHVALITSAEEG